MTLDNIVAISGKPGLYEIRTKTRQGIAVTSLLDGKRLTVINVRHTVSLLSEIAVYTLKEELPLRAVFQKIVEKENGASTHISSKENAADLKNYFSEIIPDYDREKVYPSHIRKIISWYNLLLEKGVSFEEKESDNTEKEKHQK